MARSYDSRRFPGGPYIEPSVQPALRGPKRTGPIGELIPGDDVEVARILARMGRKPRIKPIMYDIKLSGDLESELQIEVETPVPEDWEDPEMEEYQYVLKCREDMNLTTLVKVELSCSTFSSNNAMEMQIVNLTQSVEEEEVITLLNPDFLVILDEEEYFNWDEDHVQRYEIDVANAQVQWRDRLGFYFPEIGTDIRGVQLGLWFR